MSCGFCNGHGLAVVWNTDLEQLEIQKCDECEIFKTDEEANQKGLDVLKNFLTIMASARNKKRQS